MKNLSMTGAALVLFWMVRTHGYGPFALGPPLGSGSNPTAPSAGASTAGGGTGPTV